MAERITERSPRRPLTDWDSRQGAAIRDACRIALHTRSRPVSPRTDASRAWHRNDGCCHQDRVERTRCHSAGGSPGSCCAATVPGSSAAAGDFDAAGRRPAAISYSVASLRAVRWAMPASSFISSLFRPISVSKFLSLRSSAAWIA